MTTLTNEEILSLTAVELGAKIKAGELTSVEAVTAYLDRAEAVEKDINAFITLDREDALAAAVLKGGKSEEELDELRKMYREAQWYFDFCYVENSEGAHNSALARQCLDTSEEMIKEAMAKLG